MVSMDIEAMASRLPPRLEAAALTGKPGSSANGKKVSGDLEDGEINDEDSKAAIIQAARAPTPGIPSSVASSRASSSVPASSAAVQPPASISTDPSEHSAEPETPSCLSPPSLSYPDETSSDESAGSGPPSPLPLSPEELDHAKSLVLDLLGWGVSPEYLLQSGVSAHAIYRIFTDLRLRLPENMEGPSPS